MIDFLPAKHANNANEKIVLSILFALFDHFAGIFLIIFGSPDFINHIRYSLLSKKKRPKPAEVSGTLLGTHAQKFAYQRWFITKKWKKI